MELIKDINHLRKILADNLQRFSNLSPDYIKPEGFVQEIISYAHKRKNKPKESLVGCSKDSFRDAVFQAAALGLSVGPEADILVYNNSEFQVREANFQENYHGILTLAYRTGAYKVIDAEPIYQNDPPPTARKGSDFRFSFSPDYYAPKDKRGAMIAVYCYTETTNGGRDFTIMPAWEVAEIRQKAKSQKFWKAWPLQMALKSVLKKHLKYKPRDGKLSLALAHSEKTPDFDENRESPKSSPPSKDHSLNQLEQAINGEAPPPQKTVAPTPRSSDAPPSPRPENSGKDVNYVRLLSDIIDNPQYRPAILALIDDGKIDDPRQLKNGEPNVLRTQEPAAAKLIYTQIQTADNFLNNGRTIH